jgi:hypothetical protein
MTDFEGFMPTLIQPRQRYYTQRVISYYETKTTVKLYTCIVQVALKFKCAKFLSHDKPQSLYH